MASEASQIGERQTWDEGPNISEQVYQKLIDLLVSGELRPGDVIVERRMASFLNASRTPVREALGRLEAERLVYKQANRGVIVSPFSTENFVNLLNVRKLLEAEAARLAAGKLTEAQIADLRAALTGLAAIAQPTLAQVWEVDNKLHGAIATASGNPLLAEMIGDLRRRTHVFNAYRSPTAQKFSDTENFTLLDAVASGDAEHARQTMIQHIERVKTALIEQLSE
ncbi:GntR family transcriptional regulator [Ketogulonicigenium vulgare]|uniref:GntR-family transcriptional regulator n=1 Tax=Ketogulonicigenium vulgare (strain WSH-001) TaxID=759362 RepID=F9Y6F4_KETVW|nr:GntR family transcriptional regulator [Ketogulonicigenium vulgare]ADO42705.1 GntR family transcriptional regulator [Ketogulonicigenium vulgare Y25]AEM40900.1 GntR-family transcriptional regulator [Ketogulonicigenium vulgare WSH-001]ALJ82319.1 GntR family transcriptional regulator [Ketogulonicigenium vulgare]AOZ54616.1 GntR family transcriptional regulator [Ketogulonicigenium vulgare]